MHAQGLFSISKFKKNEHSANQTFSMGPWQPCLLSSLEEMWNLQKKAIDFSLFGAADSEEKTFLYQPIRDQNCQLGNMFVIKYIHNDKSV